MASSHLRKWHTDPVSCYLRKVCAALVIVAILSLMGAPLSAQEVVAPAVPWSEVTIHGFGSGVQLSEIVSKLGTPTKTTKHYAELVRYFLGGKLTFRNVINPVTEYEKGSGAITGDQIEYRGRVIASSSSTRRKDVIRVFGNPNNLTSATDRLAYDDFIEKNGKLIHSPKNRKIERYTTLVVDLRAGDGSNARVEKFTVIWSLNMSRK